MSRKLPRLLNNFALYIDGYGLAANGVAVTLPEFALTMVEHAGGGMFNPIEIPVGGTLLTLSFGLKEYSPQVYRAIGKGDTQFTFRGFARSLDGSEQAVALSATGMVKTANGMEHAPQTADYTLNYEMSLTYVALSIDGSIELEIDVPNAKWLAGGVNIVGGMAEALGF